MPLDVEDEDEAEAEDVSPEVLESARSEQEAEEAEVPRRCCPRLRARVRCFRCCRCERGSELLLRSADAWSRFQWRCKALAWFLRCLCCPLLFLLWPCCRCPKRPKQAPAPRLSTRARSSVGFGAGRSSSRLGGALGRSSSRLGGPLGRSSSRLARGGSAALGRSRSARFEEPKIQTRSRMKEVKPRAEAQLAGPVVEKKSTAREQFRDQLRKQKTEALDAEELEGWEALTWRDFLPWNWEDTFEVWKESRVKMWQELEVCLSKMEMADEDEDRLSRWARRRWRVFLFAYWDPFVDAFPSFDRIFRAFLWSLLLVPISMFAASSTFLASSLLRNMDYVEGRCQIESLPSSFVTERGVESQVLGTYLIRRFFGGSADRLEGYVLQPCEIKVLCDQDLQGPNDRCESFKMWAWRDPITCFYHQEDEYGLQNRTLLCLARPSGLQEEIFGVIISGCALMVAALVVVFVFLRRAYDRRNAKKFQAEVDEQVEKDRVEADKVAAKQYEEFQKQEQMQQQQQEGEDEDQDMEGLVWTSEKTGHSFVSKVTRQTTRSQFQSEALGNRSQTFRSERSGISR
ncbi:unnamed protein product [Effrenium voratum]|nr:unnamed protein product [Effrenium voratum]